MVEEGWRDVVVEGCGGGGGVKEGRCCCGGGMEGNVVVVVLVPWVLAGRLHGWMLMSPALSISSTLYFVHSLSAWTCLFICISLYQWIAIYFLFIYPFYVSLLIPPSASVSVYLSIIQVIYLPLFVCLCVYSVYKKTLLSLYPCLYICVLLWYSRVGSSHELDVGRDGQSGAKGFNSFINVLEDEGLAAQCFLQYSAYNSQLLSPVLEGMRME